MYRFKADPDLNYFKIILINYQFIQKLSLP